MQADLPVDDDACYSSFSDTDEEETRPPPTAAAAVAAGQWLSWMGQPVLTHQIRPPSTLPSDVSTLPGGAIYAYDSPCWLHAETCPMLSIPCRSLGLATQAER